MKFVQRARTALSVLAGRPVANRKALSSVDDSRLWQLLYDYGTSMTAWQKDLILDRDSILANWALFSCMTLIAGDIGKCNLRYVERNGQIWQETETGNAVLRRPNHYQTRQQFMEAWILSKLSWGNTYVLKQRDNRGAVVAEYILDPNRVQPLVSELGDVFYRLQRDDLSQVQGDFAAVPASEIIHDRFNCLFHPLVGLSPIFASGIAATQGIKIQTNSSKFFENMSRPSGILSAPGSISQDTADRLKASWETNYGGDKIGRVAVLGDDLKYQALGVNAEDAQMVEQLKLSAETICSTFHVPAFKIGAGTIPAGQKVEDLNQIYYADCLHTLMDAVATLQTEALVTSPRTAVRFDLDDLLKMDSQTQINVIKLGIDAGVLAPNEGRRRLNLPDVEGGDSPMLQQQNWSLEQLANRGAIPDSSSVEPPPVDNTDKALAYLWSKRAPEDLAHA